MQEHSRESRMVEAAYEPHTGRPVLSCARKKFCQNCFSDRVYLAAGIFKGAFLVYRSNSINKGSGKEKQWLILKKMNS